MPFREVPLPAAPGMPFRELPLPMAAGGPAPPGLRCMPLHPNGVGVLVLAGSSGRVDADRARVLASTGAVTESIQWFGGPGQQPGPFEVPVELFQERIEALAREADRVVLVGTSFGAEAALVVASVTPRVAGVAAFAPSRSRQPMPSTKDSSNSRAGGFWAFSMAPRIAATSTMG